MNEGGSIEMKVLNDQVKNNTLVFFENYVDIISEILQKNHTIWNHDKKKLAVCIILFARSS